MEGALERLGLTKGEIKTYLALIKHKELTKTRLASKAGISSSKVYETAERLVQKGLISSYKKNNVKVYVASNPSYLEHYIEQKEKELEKEKQLVRSLIPKLQQTYGTEEQLIFEVYEGWEGFSNVLERLFNSLPDGSTIRGIGVELLRQDLLHHYHQRRVGKNIKQKMIFPRKDYQWTDYKENEKRFIPGITNVGIGIVGKDVIIYVQDKHPLSLVISHPKITSSFEEIHEALWKIAEK